MKDYFSVRLEGDELNAMSSLALAHVGDGVFELMVRTYLACKGRLAVSAMHRETVKIVNAAAQAEFARDIMPMLSDEELSVYKRGRNTRVNSVPKHMSIADYHAATGFEALFGYLWLSGRHERLNELFAVVEEKILNY